MTAQAADKPRQRAGDGLKTCVGSLFTRLVHCHAARPDTLPTAFPLVD
jgi:hypothetical protein